MTVAECFPSSWCTIHRDRIADNLALALKLVPKGRRFCAVLKSDAYGHGIAEVVPIVLAHGVDCIGITSNAEAQAVRSAGFDGQLIRLRAATPSEMDDALSLRIEEQVTSLTTAQHLRQRIDAERYSEPLHLSINASGISRDALELATTEGIDTCRKVLDCLGANIGGICTHFPDNTPSDLRDSAALFWRQAQWVLETGGLNRDDVLIHAGSSLTLISEEPVKTDMYRCGAILYGILKPELGFRNSMALNARVISLQDYPAGASVGYDRLHRLDRDSRLACISIGYANGFARAAKDGRQIAVGNALAPVIGRVSMNTIIADVTRINAVEVGDAVTVFGDCADPGIDKDSAQDQFGTIMADLYADWGLRNHRVYV